MCVLRSFPFCAGNVDTLNALTLRVTDVGAIVLFETKHYLDDRVLLGYVIHYIQSDTQNVQIYEGRDGCGVDNWHVEDISKKEDSYKLTFDTVLLGNLEPSTQYAYFVKTYTIASEKNGGQTEVHYFKTRPSEPDAVTKLKAIPQSNDSSTLVSPTRCWCWCWGRGCFCVCRFADGM